MRTRRRFGAAVLVAAVLLGCGTAQADMITVSQSFSVGPVTSNGGSLSSTDRVAPGRYLPGAPTDPYVLALEHTVPQITGSLRVDRASASCVRGPMGNAG